MTSIMSKKTYTNAKNAGSAGRSYYPARFCGVHKLPSGRWCYLIREVVMS